MLLTHDLHGCAEGFERGLAYLGGRVVDGLDIEKKSINLLRGMFLTLRAQIILYKPRLN